MNLAQCSSEEVQMEKFIGKMALAHTDHRRSLSEVNGPNFSVKNIEVFEKIPIGNHYHERKTETFIVTGGSGKLFLEAISHPDSEVETYELFKGSVVKIEPFIAHTFVLEPGSSMICVSSAPFNPDDMDMVSHILK